MAKLPQINKVAMAAGFTVRPASARNFIARASAVGTMTTEMQRYYSLFFRRLIQGGILDKGICCYLLAAPSSAIACLNLISADYTLTPKNGISFSESIGFQGNGVSHYLDPGISDYSLVPGIGLDDVSMYCYSLTDLGGSTEYAMGATEAGNLAGIRVRNSVTATLYANSTAISQRHPTSEGFIGVSRLSATEVLVQIEDSVVTTASNSTALPTTRFNFLRLGTGVSYALNLYSFLWLGKGLTEAQSMSLFYAVREFLIHVGATDGVIELPESPAAPHYFVESDINLTTPAGLEVSQQVYPQSSNAIDNSTWPYFPASIYTSTNIEIAKASTETDAEFYFFSWLNRLSDPTKFNYSESPFWPPITGATGTSLSGKSLRLGCSSYEIANAFDRVRFKHMLGYPDADLIAEMASVGLTAVAPFNDKNASRLLTRAACAALNGDNTFYDTPGRFPTWACAYDYAYVPDYKLSDCAVANHQTGILIDYEHQDGRTQAQTLAHITDLANICLNAPGGPKKFMILSNPLLNRGALESGFAEVSGSTIVSTALPAILALPGVTWMCIVLYPSYNTATLTEYLDQSLALFGPSPDVSKIYLIVGIGYSNQTLTADEADEVNLWIRNNGILHVNIFRFYGTPGGEETRPYNVALKRIIGLTR